MIRSRALWLALAALAWLAIASCGGDDDASTSSGQATDDDDDGSPADDDNDDNDDNDDGLPPTLQVTVEPAPPGNPLARRLTVVADRPCSLAGLVTAAGEPGYGRSTPAATDERATHELWFYGLLADTTFTYRLRLAGGGDDLAVGEFTTDPLPRRAPQPLEAWSSGEERPEQWTAMSVNQLHRINPDRPFLRYYGRIMIVDRRGRPRFYHPLDAANYVEDEPFVESLQELSDGRFAFANRREIRAVDWAGTEQELFPTPFHKPILVPIHHEPYIFDEEPMTAMVLFNQTDLGVDCELYPTDLVVSDGVAWLDAGGAETASWTVFDHPDEFPIDDFGPCGCQQGFWGNGTIDLTHANSVFPAPDGDAVIVSLRNLSRVVKIDAATGAVLWQLGEGYDFAWVGDEPAGERWFNMQHDARYLPNGHITMFDNGNCREGGGDLYSRALELAVDETNMTVSLAWEHRVPYAAAMGNVVRLDDGGTFIAGGWNGQLVEVAPSGDEIWRLQYPTFLQLPNISHGLPVEAPWVYESDEP